MRLLTLPKKLAMPLLILCISILLGYLMEWRVTTDLIFYIFPFGIPLLFAYYGLKNPVRLLIINLFISVPCIIVTGLFAYRQTYFQIPAMVLIYYVVTLLVIGVIGIFVFAIYKDESLAESFLPVGVSILTLVLTFCSGRLGNELSLYVFRERLPQYEKLVEMVKEGKLRTSKHGQIALPEGYEHLAHYICIWKNEDNVTQISFSWAIGFPCKHTDYMYCSDGKTPKVSCGWADKVAENWYRVNY